jgi:hypothetical protein
LFAAPDGLPSILLPTASPGFCSMSQEGGFPDLHARSILSRVDGPVNAIIEWSS